MGRNLPKDVLDLVIASRIVAYEDQGPEAIKALDRACEAFADRVPWEGQPSCLECSDTGMADSGGFQPWGEPILVTCACSNPTQSGS